MEVLTKYFPDWRRTINELQRYSTSGQIDAGILVNVSEVNINELVYTQTKRIYKCAKVDCA